MPARRLSVCALLFGFLFAKSAGAQLALPPSAPAAVAQPEVPQDPLGRTTPRGAVRGFLTACTKGDNETTVRYLNTPPRCETAVVLVHKLYAVLNERLSTRLNEISDLPQGSLSFPADPNKDLVGTISSDTGDVKIVVERVERKGVGSVWVFSQQTLAAVPELYAELDSDKRETGLIKFLLETKIARIALIHWLCIFVGFPLFFLIGGRLNRVLSRLAGVLVRRLCKNPNLPNPDVLSVPVRLVLLAILIQWELSSITLPILAREFWSAIAAIAAIIGCVWLIMRLNRWFERVIRIRLDRRNLSGALSISRFARSAVDVVIMFVGLLLLLRYFGINASTALAGLGVGGIAVALAAQKTLENVIAGISLISDKAIRVGDLLRIGNTLGTVIDIGLRSTRIRTFDRTVVNVANGQIANACLENLSLRDQFWFHHFLGLPYDTSAGQIRSILEAVRNLVAQHDILKAGGSVRLVRFGASSLDLEIFAYVLAGDWTQFLIIQEELLLQIMDVVEAAGAKIAVPAQTIYLTNSVPYRFGGKAPTQSRMDEQALATSPFGA